jgi:hypothetical protein
VSNQEFNQGKREEQLWDGGEKAPRLLEDISDLSSPTKKINFYNILLLNEINIIGQGGTWLASSKAKHLEVMQAR